MPEPPSSHPPRRRVGVYERLRGPADGSPAQTCSETSSLFIIRPTAQWYGSLAKISGVIVAFDTAGEVIFAGANQSSNQRVERPLSVEMG
jgi:hypothetical protein